jgi:hypothetical protein
MLALAVVVSGMSLGVADVPTVPMYRIRTVHNCLMQRVTPAVVGVPTPVDVDGNAAPDLLVQVGGVPELPVRPPVPDKVGELVPQVGALFRANIIKLVPGPLPAIVELIFAAPGQGTFGGPQAIAFGYDSCGQTSPTTFSAQALIQRDTLTVTMEQSGAGASLALIGSFHEEGVNPADRYHPHAARVALTPPPATATAVVTKQGSLTSARLTTSIPTRIDVVYDNVLFDRATHAEAVIDRFPGDVTLRFGSSHLDYTLGPGVIGLLQVKLGYTEYGKQPIEVFAQMSNVQGTGTFDKLSATRAKFSATPAIGQVTAGFAEGGAVPLLHQGAPTPDYVRAIRSGAYNAATVRVRQLASVEIDWADPISVDATHAGGTMQILANFGSTSIDAWVKDLPPAVHIDYSKTQNTLHYSGSTTITEITADVVDPAGLFGRIKEVHLVLNQVPQSLTLSLPAGGAISFDANGQQVGVVDARLTSGPDVRLPAGQDGFLLRDMPTYFAIHARVSGLKKLVSSEFRNQTRPDFCLPLIGCVGEYSSGRDITIETAGGRNFKVDVVVESAATQNRQEFTTATIDQLSTQVTVTLRSLSWILRSSNVEYVRKSQVWYSALTQTPRLVFRTNAGHMNGGSAGLTATITPLPTSIYLCQAADASCSNSGFAASKGSLVFDAPVPVAVSLLDCTDAGCSMDFTSVNVTLRFIRFESHEGSPNHVLLDTNDNNTSGTVLIKAAGNQEVYVVLPNGFRSQDRHLWWPLYATAGTISCPTGTQVWVRILGAPVNVAGFVC